MRISSYGVLHLPLSKITATKEPPKIFSNPFLRSLKDLFIFLIAVRSNLAYAVQSIWKCRDARYRVLWCSKAGRIYEGKCYDGVSGSAAVVKRLRCGTGTGRFREV
ncbi:hypothetical protein PanWU01x14_262580 [Parasponia andersonii]|uniref:Uncharacterized protein n=1 Tax=Parasponia andersonii TaxID=3476 RepID=A0A2P5B839_PARAD|nr:hypothetical protein PanWU01x14_262580 [Parasponia andersonii]